MAQWVSLLASHWFGVGVLTLSALGLWAAYIYALRSHLKDAPALRVVIDYERGRLFVEHVGGGIAYRVECDPIEGGIEGYDEHGVEQSTPATCSFDRIDQLMPKARTQLQSHIEQGARIVDERFLLDVLKWGTGRDVGLPLRLRYEDNSRLGYVARVDLPIHIALNDVVKDQPTMWAPLPMTRPARVLYGASWRRNEGRVRERIRRERRADMVHVNQQRRVRAGTAPLVRP